MRQGSVLSVGLAALAVMVSACSQSSSPTAANTSNTSSSETMGQPGILAKLQNPELVVSVVDNGTYKFIFTAGASGSSDSEPVVAARTIKTVEFEVHAPNGAILDREVAREVVTTGVKGGENTASLTVFADSEWAMSGRIQEGSYATALVRGQNGELLTATRSIPVLRND